IKSKPCNRVSSGGIGSCFGTPGDDAADKIRAVQSTIPAGLGDAVEAGNIDVESLRDGGTGKDCKGNPGQTSIAGGCGSFYQGPTTSQDSCYCSRTPDTTYNLRQTMAPTPDLHTTHCGVSSVVSGIM
ncbi:hypothetical protein BDR03DRAFT_968392, partial [Suillus americanus]